LAGKYKSAGSVLPDGKTLRRQLAASFRYIKYPILTSIIAVVMPFFGALHVPLIFSWLSAHTRAGRTANQHPNDSRDISRRPGRRINPVHFPLERGGTLSPIVLGGFAQLPPFIPRIFSHSK